MKLNVMLICAIALSVSGTPADAGPFCGELSSAIDAAADGDARAADVSISTPGGSPTPARCAFSTDMSGARSLACRWAFPYRAPEANTAFSRLLDEVAACGGAPSATADAPVNHPDSYDLRLFDFRGDMIAVSLKDKGALGETFVFLRTGAAQ